MKTNWKLVKNLGQVKYFNISYVVILVVPLLANAFELISEHLKDPLIVPVTVKSLYFASLVYALGIAVYQFRCPPIIKEYENVQHYIEKNLEQFMNKTPDLKVNIVLTQLNKETQYEAFDELVKQYAALKSANDPEEQIRLSAQLDATASKTYASSIQKHLTDRYDSANLQYPGSIWTATILYIFGSLIVLTLLIVRTIVVFSN
jgi:hypothetical protein